MLRRRRAPYARVEVDPGGGLAFYSSYDAGLVAALKVEIGRAERSWDPPRKCWVIAPHRAATLAQLCDKHLGVELELPASIETSATQKTETLLVEYIGRVKARFDGTEDASGWCNGDWNVVLPGHLLKAWFGHEDSGPAGGSLFTVLGVSQHATEQEVRKAHRRAAKQWHPDVCDEPDASERFQAIQRAYEVLTDTGKRARYLAGLALQSHTEATGQPVEEYAPPLRCGRITVEATVSLGKYQVEKILAWEDVVKDGRTMVSSWKRGASHFAIKWV